MSRFSNNDEFPKVRYKNTSAELIVAFDLHLNKVNKVDYFLNHWLLRFKKVKLFIIRHSYKNIKYSIGSRADRGRKKRDA